VDEGLENHWRFSEVARQLLPIGGEIAGA